jgi:hypothetical protein
MTTAPLLKKRGKGIFVEKIITLKQLPLLS